MLKKYFDKRKAEKNIKDCGKNLGDIFNDDSLYFCL